MTAEEVLAIKLPTNDAEAETVRDYLKALLLALWQDGESFSGKRPFGNSGWDSDLLDALPESATVSRDADDLIKDAIRAL